MMGQIVVDDTDNNIQYMGQGWFLDDTGSQDEVGAYGPTYLRSLHGTKLNGTLSYKFEGTSVIVRGTTNRKKTQPGIFDPSWECFVDKISIGAATPVEFAANNWGLCEANELFDGPHELSIQVAAANRTFWLDYILYTPSPTLSPKDAVVVVESNDPGIVYDSEWQPLGDGNMTQTTGSTAKFKFVGTSLSWVGLIPNEYPHSASSATYSIDGGPSIPFQLHGLLPGPRDTLFHQTFFTTPDLGPGPHDLLVAYNGNSQQTPLSLDYLHVTTTSTSGSPSPPMSASQPEKSGPPIGAIVGGVVGGILMISLGLFLLWMYGRRKIRAKRLLEEGDEGNPTNVLGISPFVHDYRLPRQIIQKSSLGISTGVTSSNESARAEYNTSPPPLPPKSHHFSPASSSVQKRPFHSNHQYPSMVDASSSGSSDQTSSVMGVGDEIQSLQVAGVARDPPHGVLHQDSGWRLREESTTPLEDIPPHYTAM